MAETALIETMRILGVEHDDASDSIKMNRVNDVAKYFGGFSDGIEIMRRVAVKLPKDQRVDGLHHYMAMRQEHDTLAKEVSDEEPKLLQKKTKLKGLKRTLESVE
jgi:hypothetical protein